MSLLVVASLLWGVERVFLLMGTYTVIDLPDERKVYQTYMFLRSVEEKISTFIDSSEVSAINRSSGKGPVSVSEYTLEVIADALVAKEKTYGYFDITLGSGGSDLRIYGGKVYAGRDVRIDLGGIGKGYAVEKGYEHARTEWGFIAIAGDMKVWGHRRVLAVRDPLEGGSLLQMVNARDLCLSTSGNYIKEHIRQEDPDLVQITVVYPNCTFADAYATALFAMPRDLRRRFYRENPDVGSLEVFRDGSLYFNPAFFRYFEAVYIKKKSNLKK